MKSSIYWLFVTWWGRTIPGKYSISERAGGQQPGGRGGAGGAGVSPGRRDGRGAPGTASLVRKWPGQGYWTARWYCTARRYWTTRWYCTPKWGWTADTLQSSDTKQPSNIVLILYNQVTQCIACQLLAEVRKWGCSSTCPPKYKNIRGNFCKRWNTITVNYSGYMEFVTQA